MKILSTLLFLSSSKSLAFQLLQVHVRVGLPPPLSYKTKSHKRNSSSSIILNATSPKPKTINTSTIDKDDDKMNTRRSFMTNVSSMVANLALVGCTITTTSSSLPSFAQELSSSIATTSSLVDVYFGVGT